MGCLLDDAYKSHWTEILKRTLAENGVRHILVPNTKINQPNDQTINRVVEQSIIKQLHTWCADRRKADSEGKAVPCLSKELLMAVHGKHRFK